MDEHRRPDVGAVAEEVDDAVVVEVALADVVADLDAGVPGGEAAIELGARLIGVLERHLAERDQPVTARSDASPG